ncbi:MAG: hypothetical protein PVH61_10060 [Candidatus Aminicenantes bacterium]|jgi:hypothetical protein
MKIVTVFIFIACFLSCLSARGTDTARMPDSGNNGLKYNFTYNFQTDMKGRILLLVPYRFYHEASASVNFIARKNKEGHDEFCFAGIGGTGYVMTTGGLRGTSLYFFTADYDLEKAAKFRENKIVDFKKAEPYYSENIRKIRRRPMKILSTTEDSIRFNRDPRGIHYNSQVNIRLTDSHSFTYSNIYKILGKVLNLYNHSFLPGGGRRPHPIHGQPDAVLSGASSQKFAENTNFHKVLAKRGWHPQPIHGQPDAVLSGASSQKLAENTNFHKVLAKRGWHPHPIHGQPDAVLSGASSQKLAENTNFQKVLAKRGWHPQPIHGQPDVVLSGASSQKLAENTNFHKVLAKRGWHPQPIHGQSDVVLSGASSQKLAEKTNFHKVLAKSEDRPKVNRLEQLSHRLWFSKPLDFSKPLEEVVRLTSQYAEKNLRFKQKQKFKIQYRITALDNIHMEICGESYPDVIMGKKMKIRHILRKIKLRLEDEVVKEDMIFIDFRDKKGKGGTIRLKLQLL